jgi:diguanylate cyclase (GGDEF)-like protein
MINNDKPSQILIVDDSQLDLELLDHFMRENGYRTVTAQTGAEALEFIQSNTPDLILLDMMMPIMDGISVCEQLKVQEGTHNIPVIFITALSDIQHKIEAFKVGGVDYIVKPFIQEEVLARVNVHLKLKKALEKLEEMSRTDPMTGIGNRRFAYEILAKQIEMVNREQSSFIVCYVDIDNLKTINDNHGHAAGDRLIKTVVDSLKGVIRSSDYLFRMGGDEFLIIFPKAKLDESEKLIERIRESLNKQTICGNPIDFSFGLSEFNAGASLSIDELIKRADSRMFKAKKIKKSEIILQ